MAWLYILSVFLHIVAATVWIGGALFLVLVLVPVIRNPDLQQHAPVLLQLSGRRFKHVGWISLIVLLVTGLVNLHFKGFLVAMASGTLWSMPVGHVVATKLVVVAIILVLSLVHDFYIGPKAVTLMREQAGSPEAIRCRKTASWFGRVNVLLGLLTVLLGVMIVRGVPM